MRYLLLIFLIGCQTITAQKESEVVKDDREFQELLQKVEENNQLSAIIQEQASKKQSKIVKETVTKIVTLKEENKDLKTELDEIKVKLDSVSADTLLPFVILPISSKKDI